MFWRNVLPPSWCPQNRSMWTVQWWLVTYKECLANHGYTRRTKGKGLSQANRSYDFKQSPFLGFTSGRQENPEDRNCDLISICHSATLGMISTWIGNNFICASKWCDVHSWRIPVAFCLLRNGFGAPTANSGRIHPPPSCCWDAVCSILQADKIILFLHVQVYLMYLFSNSNFIYNEHKNYSNTCLKQHVNYGQSCLYNISLVRRISVKVCATFNKENNFNN